MTSVRVEVVLGDNLGPIIPAAQYTISVSEGIVLNSPVFSVPVRIEIQCIIYSYT